MLLVDNLSRQNINLLKQMKNSFFKRKSDILVYATNKASAPDLNSFRIKIQKNKKISTRYYDMLAAIHRTYKYKPILITIGNPSFFRNNIDENALDSVFTFHKPFSSKKILKVFNSDYPHLLKHKYRMHIKDHKKKAQSSNLRSLDIPILSMSQIEIMLKYRKAVFLKLHHKVKIIKRKNFNNFLYSLIQQYGDNTLYLIPLSSDSLVSSAKALKTFSNAIGFKQNMIVGVLDEQTDDIHSLLIKKKLDSVVYGASPRAKRMPVYGVL